MGGGAIAGESRARGDPYTRANSDLLQHPTPPPSINNITNNNNSD
jgi:hypothetical protein